MGVSSDSSQRATKLREEAGGRLPGSTEMAQALDLLELAGGRKKCFELGNNLCKQHFREEKNSSEKIKKQTFKKTNWQFCVGRVPRER